MSSEGTERPATGPALGLLAVAAVLFAGALSVPYLPGRDPSTALAQRYDLDNQHRGEASFNVDLIRAGAVLPVATAGAPKAGDQLAFRYDGAGFVFLWIIAVSEGGTIAPIPVDRAAGQWGLRAEPHGGLLTSTSTAWTGAPLVVLAHFAPVPLTLKEVEAAAAAAAKSNRTPEAIAGAIGLPGRTIIKPLR